MTVIYEDFTCPFAESRVVYLSINFERDTVDIIDYEEGVVYWTGQGPGSILAAEKECTLHNLRNLGHATSTKTLEDLANDMFGDFHTIPLNRGES